MPARTPFLLLGDGPTEASGLGRIARDLAGQILTDPEIAPLVDFVQVGGTIPPVWTAWSHYPLDRSDDWGAFNTAQIYRSIWGDQPGILFGVWDPARLWYHLHQDLPVQRWGYCAIDGQNAAERIGGPAQETLQRFDRVLAYGRFGAGVISRSTDNKPVPWLPHGVQLWQYQYCDDEERAAARARLGPHALSKVIIGCVMTNQPRKDFGLLFATFARLLQFGIPAHLWLHTDTLVKDWSVQQLVEDFGVQKRVTVTGLGEDLSDSQMAALYQQCTITLLPSLGEGYGYPIVESAASGVPCVHSQWAEGQAYVPLSAWQVPVREIRLEGVYGIARPVMRSEDWANAALRAIRWAQDEGETGRAYLRGSVAHLAWSSLWGRWRSWFKQGLGGGIA